MPRKTPEEDWLNEPESEGEHDYHSSSHSPHEGDLAPWMQAGYSGGVPTAGKVFYVNAYVLVFGKPKGEREARYEENLGVGTSMTVGTFPPGTTMGSESMYYPYASVPVRLEDRDNVKSIFTYLYKVATDLNFPFARIEIEKTFPRSGHVELPNGRWFPYNTQARFTHPDLVWMNGYNVNRLYGGPEEEGWWYNAGDAIASIPIHEWDDKEVMPERNYWQQYLADSVGWHSKFGLGSVLGHDNFESGLSSEFAQDYPQETPHYE